MSHRSSSAAAGAAVRPTRAAEPPGGGARFAHVLGRYLGRSAMSLGVLPSAIGPAGGARAGTTTSLAPRTPGAGEVPAQGAAHGRVDRRPDVEPDGHDESRGRGALEADLLDPTARHAAMLAPPQALAGAVAPSAHEAAEAPRARMSLEELLPALVKRIAWAGDRHRGSVRMELGAGAYAGTTLVVHADAGRVRVEVSGAAADALRPRLEERLRRHGLDVDSVT